MAKTVARSLVVCVSYLLFFFIYSGSGQDLYPEYPNDYYYAAPTDPELVPEPRGPEDLGLFANSEQVGYFDHGGCFVSEPFNASTYSGPPFPAEESPTGCDQSQMWGPFISQVQGMGSQLPTCYDPESDFPKQIDELYTTASFFFENMYDAYIDDEACFVQGWQQAHDAIFDLFFRYRTIPNDCVKDTGPPFMLDTDECCDVDNGTGWWSNMSIPWLTTTQPFNCFTSRIPVGRATAPPCFYTPPPSTPPGGGGWTPSPSPPPPNGRALASLTSSNQQRQAARGSEPSPRPLGPNDDGITQQEEKRAGPPVCPDRVPGSNATLVGPLGTNPSTTGPPNDPNVCVRPVIPTSDRTPDSLRRAFNNEAAWRAYQRLRAERLAFKQRNRNILRGFNEPKGSTAWNQARDHLLNDIIKSPQTRAQVADLIETGNPRFEFKENSPFLDRMVFEDAAWSTKFHDGAWTILDLIFVRKSDASPNSPNTAHEASHEVTRMVKRAMFGDAALPPNQLATQQQCQQFMERYLYEEIMSQTQNVGRDGSSWQELSRNIETDYLSTARDILIENGQAKNGPEMAAAKAAALQNAKELIATLQRMETLAQTLVERGLIANREQLATLMRRMMQTRSTPGAFMELWKGLTQEQLIKLAERVPVEQWSKLTSRQQIDTILARSPLKQALIRHGPGMAGAGFAFSLLELYCGNGFDAQKWHEILPRPIPFLPYSFSQIFKGIIPKRWLAYQTQDLGVVGTTVAVTATTTAELALLVGYDKLLTPAVCWGLRAAGAARAATVLSRFGLLRILGPVTIPFMAWFAPETVGAPSVLGANTEQTFRMSMWAVVGGAMGGGFATGGPVGAVVGAFVGATVLFGRALVEYNNVVREGDEAIRRMGVHITMMHARNGLMRHDNFGADNVVTAEARKYFTDYAQGVLLALLMDNRIVTVERLQQMQPGQAIRIYQLCTELVASPGSSSKQRELNRIINDVDAVDTTLTSNVMTYYQQAKDYYTQMENVYKRAVRIRYEPTSNRWTATHDLVAINNAFKSAGMPTATKEQQREWITNRLPLIADLMSPERKQTGGYIANYAPDIYNCLFCTELRTNFTNAEELAMQVRSQLSQPWVLRRLGPAMGTLWLAALNGERSLTDEQLVECMRLLNRTVECPAAQRKGEQRGRQRAFQAFQNRTGAGGGNNRRELPWGDPSLDGDWKLMRAQMLLGGGFNQMEPSIIETGDGKMMAQYGSNTLLQFRRDTATNRLMVSAFRTASPVDFTAGSNPNAQQATAATFYEDMQWILDHQDNMDGFMEELESKLQLNGGVEMDWQATQMMYYDLRQVLTTSEILATGTEDAIFLVLHAFYISEADAATVATQLNSVWTSYWQSPTYNANAPEDNTHFHRFVQMMVSGVQKLESYGVVLNAQTMNFVVDGLRNYAMAGFPTLPPV